MNLVWRVFFTPPREPSASGFTHGCLLHPSIWQLRKRAVQARNIRKSQRNRDGSPQSIPRDGRANESYLERFGEAFVCS